MKGLSLEVRVGLLILAAMGILGGFVFLLGGFDLGERYTIYVDFGNPGNVKPGASVNIGSIQVGSVEDIEYRGNRLDPQTGRRSLVRIRLALDEEVRDTIHEDALFYVTSTSMLGESIIGVDPGDPRLPVLPEGSVVEGVDPPRLDLAMAMAFELLENMVKLFRANRDEIQDLLQGASDMLRSVNRILTDHADQIDRIITNIETATGEAGELMVSARKTIDGAEVQRIVGNLDKTLSVVSKDIEPIMEDVKGLTGKANETLDAIGPEERERIRAAVSKAAKAVDDAQEIVAHIREGRGTVGAVMMDEEIYDDIQEMLRDLKHNPWKLFWRE
jgi:phospholipid/cholesterol/gamma-HCH transport system substrate-binding protein